MLKRPLVSTFAAACIYAIGVHAAFSADMAPLETADPLLHGDITIYGWGPTIGGEVGVNGFGPVDIPDSSGDLQNMARQA